MCPQCLTGVATEGTPVGRPLRPGPDQTLRAAAADGLRGAAQRVGRRVLHRARLLQRGAEPNAPAGAPGHHPPVPALRLFLNNYLISTVLLTP